MLCPHYQRRHFRGFIQLPWSGRQLGVLRGCFMVITSARGPPLGLRFGLCEGHRDALLSPPLKEELTVPTAMSAVSSSRAVSAAEVHLIQDRALPWQPNN